MSGNAAPAPSEGTAPPKASSGAASAASPSSSWLAHLWPWGSRQLSESPAGPPTSSRLEVKSGPGSSAGSKGPALVPSEIGSSTSRGILGPSALPAEKLLVSSSSASDSSPSAEQGPRGHRCNDRLEDVIQASASVNVQLALTGSND